MNKLLILQICIMINILLISFFISSFFIFNNQSSSYFNFGWSEHFIFVSIKINTCFKYLALCIFIFLFNMSEILLNDVGYPIIHFSTYNPYNNKIDDLSRFNLEMYSNIIFFIQTFRKLSQVLITLSQIDIALISLITYQISAFIAIRYLLDNKTFTHNDITNIKYESINESNHLINESNHLINESNPLIKNSKFNKVYISI
jgi:hypothetical protein